MATPGPTPAATEGRIRNEPKNDATHLSEPCFVENPLPVASWLVSKLFARWAPRSSAALSGVV
jgi:hypothetical protein